MTCNRAELIFIFFNFFQRFIAFINYTDRFFFSTFSMGIIHIERLGGSVSLRQLRDGSIFAKVFFLSHDEVSGEPLM